MKEKDYKRIIQESIAMFDAAISVFIYERKCFGNIILKIVDKNEKIREYILDRGDIYVGSKLIISHNDYTFKKENHVFEQFVRCVVQDLSKS